MFLGGTQCQTALRSLYFPYFLNNRTSLVLCLPLISWLTVPTPFLRLICPKLQSKRGRTRIQIRDPVTDKPSGLFFFYMVGNRNIQHAVLVRMLLMLLVSFPNSKTDSTNWTVPQINNYCKDPESVTTHPIILCQFTSNVVYLIKRKLTHVNASPEIQHWSVFAVLIIINLPRTWNQASNILVLNQLSVIQPCRIEPSLLEIFILEVLLFLGKYAVSDTGNCLKARICLGLEQIGAERTSILLSISHYREHRDFVVQDPQQCFLKGDPTTHHLAGEYVGVEASFQMSSNRLYCEVIQESAF